LFTEKKNRANRDEPSRIPTVPEVSKTVPNTVSNYFCAYIFITFEIRKLLD
jgi:hypothetical protein